MMIVPFPDCINRTTLVADHVFGLWEELFALLLIQTEQVSVAVVSVLLFYSYRSDSQLPSRSDVVHSSKPGAAHSLRILHFTKAPQTWISIQVSS